MLPDRRTTIPLSPLALKPSCYNLCSNSRIRSDVCLLTNTVTKTSSSIRTNRPNGVAVFEGSPIWYNIYVVYITSILSLNVGADCYDHI